MMKEQMTDELLEDSINAIKAAIAWKIENEIAISSLEVAYYNKHFTEEEKAKTERIIELNRKAMLGIITKDHNPIHE